MIRGGEVLGRVECVHVTDRERASMRRVEQVRAVAGKGVEGDRYLLGSGRYSGQAHADEGRHTTLIKPKSWKGCPAGIELSAAKSRCNIATWDVQLNDLVGERFHVGEVLCEGVRLCEPCLYLVEVTRKPVLGPLIHRGGLRAHILTGGYIFDGDILRRESGPG